MLSIFKSLSDENRLRLINLLMHYELCVCELEVVLNLSQSNVSRHLGILRNLKIIAAVKDAQWVHYKVDEKFSAENAMLIDYLQRGFEKEAIFVRDLEKCKVYKNSNYNCQDITSDKSKVEAFILNHLG
jgi:ArsR family transcriptional regulator, arsenate/arsenite/antimonite-responsive transcriptional repressor